jgi:5-methylcytosine-specific restriction endonuclease McrA/predicted RNA-binding Zn-ribbon protein involved in translation (DUF1610 family)
VADDWVARWERKRRTHCSLCSRHVRSLWVIIYSVRMIRATGYLSIVPRCVNRAECEAAWDAARQRERVRSEKPADLSLKPLSRAVRGECRWCGTAIYRVDKNGNVVVDRRRMWHIGREVHPDAQPEPDCLAEYNAQKFTFREAVGARDDYTCQSCGLNVGAEQRAWALECRAWDNYVERYRRESTEDRVEREESGDPFDWDPDAPSAWKREREREREWFERNRRFKPPQWHADHIVPLEDGGAHEVANGQCLCGPCHAQKTGRENAERAARRREELAAA